MTRLLPTRHPVRRIVGAVLLALFYGAVVAFFSVIAGAQTTQPAAVFFQPQRNVKMLADIGVGIFIGPEIPNAKNLPPDVLAIAQAAWVQAVADVGGKVVLKNPKGPLPAHCVGVMMTLDEANGHNILPAALKPESDALHAAYPGVPVWISLAGDKISSANLAKPAEQQLLLDYLSLADVVTIDVYSKNRNADRYPDTWSGDVVKKVRTLAPGKPVLAWLEMNDQQLSPPPVGQGTNRAPTAAEIKAQADYVLAQGGSIGWFATCDTGKYGWSGAGDSYWPFKDRNGVSIQPQLDMVAQVSRSLRPATQPTTLPTTAPTTQPTLADVLAELRAFRAESAKPLVRQQ